MNFNQITSEGEDHQYSSIDKSQTEIEKEQKAILERERDEIKIQQQQSNNQQQQFKKEKDNEEKQQMSISFDEQIKDQEQLEKMLFGQQQSSENELEDQRNMKQRDEQQQFNNMENLANHEKDDQLSELNIEYFGLQKKLEQLNLQINELLNHLAQTNIDVTLIELKQNYLENLKLQFSNKWQQLQQTIKVDSLVDLDQLLKNCRAFIKDWEKQVNEEAELLDDLGKDIETKLQEQELQIETVYGQAKEIFDILSVNVWKQLRYYDDIINQIKQFESYPDTDAISQELSNELTKLQTMYQTGLNDYNLIEIKSQEAESQTRYISYVLIEKLTDIGANLQQHLEQLRITLEYCQDNNILLTSLNINISMEILKLYEEKQQLLTIQSKLTENFQSIQEHYQTKQYDKLNEAAFCFSQLHQSKDIFIEQQNVKIDKWQEFTMLLQQQYLAPLITVKSLLMIIKLYHIKRLASRLTKGYVRAISRNLQLHNYSTFQKDQQDLKTLQQHLTKEAIKTIEYQEIIKNLQLTGQSGENILPLLEQDFKDVSQVQSYLLLKIQTLDRIKLRGCVKDQKLIKEIVDNDILDKEFKQMLIYFKLEQLIK